MVYESRSDYLEKSMSGPSLRMQSILTIAAATVCFGSFSPAQAHTLQIGGTGSATVLMQRLGAAFEAKETPQYK